MHDGSASLIVRTESEFDEYVAERLPQLLDRATTHTKRFLRETGQWENDVLHEKLAQRWGYELLERFLRHGRGEVPCRPLHLLDSIIFQHCSQPDGCLLPESDSPTVRFVDGLLSQAVHSRDAMMSTFYHLYGLGQQQVTKILALGAVERQRVYKNYRRWRASGWGQMLKDAGLKESELLRLQEYKRRRPGRLQKEIERVLPLLQNHYRKSEPAFYPCLSREQWQDVYAENYGQDYRGWHLPLCQECLAKVWTLQHEAETNGSVPRLNLELHLWPKAPAMAS